MGWCDGSPGAFQDGQTVPMILLNKGLDLPPPGTIREVQYSRLLGLRCFQQVTASDRPCRAGILSPAIPGRAKGSSLRQLAVSTNSRAEPKNVLASIAVKDLDSAVRWYEKLFNRPPSRPMPEVAEWSFERGGSLQVYQLPERAGFGSFTLVVTSVEEQIPQLDKLGIDTTNRTSGDRVRTVMITDPEGNHIAFAEPIDPGLAR